MSALYFVILLSRYSGMRFSFSLTNWSESELRGPVEGWFARAFFVHWTLWKVDGKDDCRNFCGPGLKDFIGFRKHLTFGTISFYLCNKRWQKMVEIFVCSPVFGSNKLMAFGRRMAPLASPTFRRWWPPTTLLSTTFSPWLQPYATARHISCGIAQSVYLHQTQAFILKASRWWVCMLMTSSFLWQWCQLNRLYNHFSKTRFSKPWQKMSNTDTTSTPPSKMSSGLGKKIR